MPTRPLIWFGVRAVEAITAVLPLPLLMACAEGAGALWWTLSPGRRRIAHANLEIAFGSALDRRARARIGRRCCQGLVRLFAEVAAKDRLLGPPSQPCPRLRSGGDYSRVDADIARGGGLVVTAHLGNWEIAAEAVRRHGVDLKAMARSVDDSLVEAWLVRRRGGATALIPKTGGTAHVLRAIRSGTWVAVLADQNAGRHGLFVPFFGLEASTYPTPAAIALRLGVPIYFGTCVRRPGLEGFDTHIERLPDPDPTQPYDEAVRAITLDLTRRTEAAIRRAPEQYNWIHRRWKTRPPGRDGSEPGQPFYARLWPADHPRTHLHETA